MPMMAGAVAEEADLDMGLAPGGLMAEIDLRNPYK